MDLSISDEVLAMLVCPTTGQALRLATAADLAHWTSKEPFEGVLVSADGSRAYPVRDGFPVIVVAEALTRQG